MKTFSGFTFTVAALLCPVIFSQLLINHEERVLLFGFVILNIFLCGLYALSYRKDRNVDAAKIPDNLEYSLLYYSGGFFQLCALARPYAVWVSLKPTYSQRFEAFVYPNVTHEMLAQALLWSVIFFLLGRCLIAVCHILQLPEK